jgi:hypothetical protein
VHFARQRPELWDDTEPVRDATSNAGCDFLPTEASSELSKDSERKNVELTMTEADKEALGTDYAAGSVSRAEAKRYPLVHRGSIRFAMDLYRTESEQDKFIEEGLRARLPGQEGYRHSSFWGVIRSFFERSTPRRG